MLLLLHPNVLVSVCMYPHSMNHTTCRMGCKPANLLLTRIGINIHTQTELGAWLIGNDRWVEMHCDTTASARSVSGCCICVGVTGKNV
jgi:hypothetical protein